jgi:hypothetical protein
MPPPGEGCGIAGDGGLFAPSQLGKKATHSRIHVLAPRFKKLRLDLWHIEISEIRIQPMWAARVIAVPGDVSPLVARPE